MDDESMFPSWFIQGAMFFFVCFIIVVVIFFVRYQREKLRMAKVVNHPILSLGSHPKTLTPGQPFELLIQLDPQNNDIHAFDIVLHYDDAKIAFQNPNDLSANISSSYQLLKGENNQLTHIDPVSKTIRIVGVNTRGAFSSLVVIARIEVKLSDTAPVGFYQLFTWDAVETKLGDYIKIREIEKQQKMFAVKELAK